MGLFKSKDERRVEREMKIRSGMRSIEKSIRQQEKFSEDFIKNAPNQMKASKALSPGFLSTFAA